MKGFYWHVHHDVLLEYCWDYEERKEFIENHKPPWEIALRLKLFKPVQGKLPREIVKAGKACVKAWEAYDKAREACVKAWEAYDKAREAYDKAISENQEYIGQLHAKECPDCPWNGKRIVFER